MKKIDLYLPFTATLEESAHFDKIVNALKKSGIALNYSSFLDRQPDSIGLTGIKGLGVCFDYKEEDEAAIELLLKQPQNCPLPTA